MKSSTGNVELTCDVSPDFCDECKALHADADVRGGKVRSVEVRCEVADAVDYGIDKDKEAGLSINQICRKIRAKMEKAGSPFAEWNDREKYLCSPLRDAIKFLRKAEKKKKRADNDDFGFPG